MKVFYERSDSERSKRLQNIRYCSKYYYVFCCCFSLFFFVNLSCMQTYYFTSLSFLNLFFITFFFFFFVVVHRSSSSVLSFFLCVFGQTLTNAQFHTNIFKYVKYIAQGCCESVMDIFFNFIYFLRGCIWTQFVLIIMHFWNLILFRTIRDLHFSQLLNSDDLPLF